MAEMWISMGPQHPMTHGLWTLKVKVDGETVVDTEPDLGYIHRGVEKICEARDFTQITTYCDRLCYASANTWSHSYIYAAEDLLEVEVPGEERPVVALAELEQRGLGEGELSLHGRVRRRAESGALQLYLRSFLALDELREHLVCLVVRGAIEYRLQLLLRSLFQLAERLRV